MSYFLTNKLNTTNIAYEKVIPNSNTTIMVSQLLSSNQTKYIVKDVSAIFNARQMTQ